MSNGRFRGHFFQQLNHQRVGLMAQGLPAVESAVFLKALLLVGLSRQQFDFTDGSLSVSGKRMTADEFAGWIAGVTPQVTAARALKALEVLCGAGLLSIKGKGHYVRIVDWAKDQGGAPTAGADRMRKMRDENRLADARGALSKFDGTVFEADDLIYQIQSALKCKRQIAGKILDALGDEGFVMPAEGGRLCLRVGVSPKPAAPSALHPPHESEGAIARESEGHMMRPAGVTCDNHYHNHNHKRDVNTSHDHDRRAPGYERGHEKSEPPAGSLRSPAGSGFDENDGGGCSAEGAGYRADRADRSTDGKRGLDIFSVPDSDLPEAACRICRPSDFAKSKGILTSKMMGLRRVFGPQKARQIFCEETAAVQTDILCPGARELREPARELCARLNERMGQPRRKERVA